MVLELNSSEMMLAEKIIFIGMRKATDSMTFFTREKLVIKNLKITVKDVSVMNNFSNNISKEPITILTTELIGQLSGYSYLLFSDNDISKLMELCIPEQHKSMSEKSMQMLDSLLLEIDNIVSASVITQFSNILKVKIHGGVPSLKRLNAGELITYLSENHRSVPFLLSIECDFSNNNMSLNPEFIWILYSEFIKAVKNVAKDNNTIEAVNQFYNTINDNRAN